ncbi:YsnF/AvaK domain-containing protein [Metabacillus fastidiosus]|uniref:YsnF/AvaK domain-containing protein n=1 Tax=Metabacillus fastidiosus TaxID=1458 RepID=UPI003D28EFA1
MGKYIILGAITGGIVAWVTGLTIVTVLVLGAIIGGINYMINSRKNTEKAPKKTDKNKEQTLQLREEQLDIKKKQVQTGEVKVRKEVIEEQKTFTVPIRREEMVIEAGDEEEFRIPLKEEEIKISKYPVQVNEVSITTRQIQEMKQIKEKLKKETADVEVAGEADVIKNPPSETKD